MRFSGKCCLILCAGVLAFGPVASGAVVYDSDGFEPANPDGTAYTAGNELEGQDTADGPWKEAGDTMNAGAIVTTEPPGQVQSGLQSAEVQRDANGQGFWGVEKLVDDVAPATPIKIGWDMYVEDATDGAANPSEGFGPFFGVEANDANDSGTSFPLLIAQAGLDASTGEFLYSDEELFVQTTGDTFSLEEWHDFEMTLDYDGSGSGQYSVSVDGTQVLSREFIDDEQGNGIDDFTAAPLSTFAAFGDQVSQQRSGTAYYDNYAVRVVPEPSSLLGGLVLGGGALLFRGRSARSQARG